MGHVERRADWLPWSPGSGPGRQASAVAEGARAVQEWGGAWHDATPAVLGGGAHFAPRRSEIHGFLACQ